MMPRGMIKPVFIGDDADMRQAAEENQGADLELLALWWRGESRPIGTRRTTLEVQTYVLERAPDKARAIERIRPGSSVIISGSQMRLHRRQQELFKTAGYNIGANGSRPALFDRRWRRHFRFQSRRAIGIDNHPGFAGIAFAALGSYAGSQKKCEADNKQAGEQCSSSQGVLVSSNQFLVLLNSKREEGKIDSNCCD